MKVMPVMTGLEMGRESNPLFHRPWAIGFIRRLDLHRVYDGGSKSHLNLRLNNQVNYSHENQRYVEKS